MNYEGLICPHCFMIFNREDRIPLIIPSCGHTYCSSCIRNFFAKATPSQPFVCPDDRSTLPPSIVDISQFPKNLMLLNLVDKLDTPKPPTSQYSYTSITPSLPNTVPGRDSIQNKFKIPTFTANISMINDKPPSPSAGYSPRDGTSSRYGGYSERDTGRLSVRSYSAIRETLSRRSSFLQNVENHVCKDHGKRLEFICLDHQCRVCANCALVGAHRNHDIRPEEEVLKEVGAKADELIEILQGLEGTQTVIPTDRFLDFFTRKLNEKVTELETNVQQKFEDYISFLRMKEEKIINDINAKFLSLENYLQNVNELPIETRTKINSWREDAGGLLQIIYDKADKGDIIYELVENKPNSQAYIVKNGLNLIKEIEDYKNAPLEILERELSRIYVDFNTSFPTLIDKVCTLIVPETDLNRNPVKNAPETEVEPVLNFKRINSLNAKLKSSVDQRFDIDNDLLNFEWNNGQSPGYGDLIKRVENMPQLPTTLEKTLDFDTTHLNSYTYTNYGNISNISPIHEPFDKSVRSSGASEFEKIKIPKINIGPVKETAGSRSGLTPKGSTSQNRGQSRSVSPGGRSIGGGDDHSIRTARKKRKAIKVPEKYEHVIKGIEADNIEIADLFDAGLADEGTILLSDYIKDCKNLKTLKLVKNRITDEGANALVSALFKNSSIDNLHLSQNLLTEKTIDMFLELFKVKHNIKTIFFNRNSIKNLMKIKPKIKEIEGLGVTISI